MKSDRRVAILDSVFILDESEQVAVTGAERYLVNLYKLIEDLGYEPCVWQPGRTAHQYDGMRIEGLPWGSVEFSGLPELNRHFFDRTVSYDKSIYMAPFLAFPCQRARSVVLSHGISWDYPAHPWASTSGPCNQEWLRRLHYAVAAADLFISVDTNTLNWIRATWPGHESRHTYIPNFVNTDLFFPRESSGEKVVVLYPRRLDQARGLDDAKVAARILTRRHEFVEFHFIGQGISDAAEADMRRWAEDIPRCQYRWVPRQDMPEVYRQADIVLIPTRSCEGTSLSCLEAMASGKAVICGQVGGLTDLVIDGFNGRLIDVAPETLTGAIDDLILDPAKRRRLGERARETAGVFSLRQWKRRWAQALGSVWN